MIILWNPPFIAKIRLREMIVGEQIAKFLLREKNTFYSMKQLQTANYISIFTKVNVFKIFNKM